LTQNYQSVLVSGLLASAGEDKEACLDDEKELLLHFRMRKGSRSCRARYHPYSLLKSPVLSRGCPFIEKKIIDKIDKF
jgi:hypothetical protein